MKPTHALYEASRAFERAAESVEVKEHAAMPVVLHSERLGVLVPVQSKTRPEHTYYMAWAPVSGWVHADNTCPAFKECWHQRKAEEIMTSLVVQKGEGRELVERPVLLVQYDAQAISAGTDPATVAKWVYNLPGGGGQGVGVRGAEEGMRLLASHGEVIRVDACVLAHQDDREAFFMATASRYVVSPDGIEVKLDSQQRGKRVSKWEQHSDSYMQSHRSAAVEYFNPNWFELGVVKASRNAALALMPSNVKSALLKAGLDAAGGGSRPQQQRQNAPRQPQQPPANVARQTDEASSSMRATQQAPVSASDGIGVAPPVAMPAAPSPASPMATQEQLATITEWTDTIRGLTDGKQRLAAIDASRRSTFPYVVDEDGWKSGRLTEADAESYIAILRDAGDNTPAPAEPVQPSPA